MFAEVKVGQGADRDVNVSTILSKLESRRIPTTETEVDPLLSSFPLHFACFVFVILVR